MSTTLGKLIHRENKPHLIQIMLSFKGNDTNDMLCELFDSQIQLVISYEIYSTNLLHSLTSIMSCNVLYIVETLSFCTHI